MRTRERVCVCVCVCVCISAQILLRKVLEDIMPEDAHIRCSGRIRGEGHDVGEGLRFVCPTAGNAEMNFILSTPCM